MSLRTCQVCGLEAVDMKGLELFRKASGMLYGRRNLCKRCHVKTEYERKHNPPKPNVELGYLRKCLHCGLEAKTTEDLTLFKTNSHMKYQHANICMNCFNSHRRYDGIYGEQMKQRDLVNNKKRLTFRGKSILFRENPRTNICSMCLGSYPKELTRQTCLHHTRYDENNPLANTVELCVSCHTKVHQEQGDVSRLMGTVLLMPKKRLAMAWKAKEGLK